MLGEERKSFTHPRLKSRRGVLVDLAHDVLTIAQPAEIRQTLAEDADLTAVLAGETVTQGPVRRPRCAWRPPPVC